MSFPTVHSWLREATRQLTAAGIASARLDAELLLSHALKKPREYLLAHPELSMHKVHKGRTFMHFMHLNKWLERRVRREPLAYITGEKEFYGRTFRVSADVLVPRPESEALIELTKQLPLKKDDILIDVGTGSGVLAVTAKLEIPKLSVLATDTSREALATARQNARRLRAEVAFDTGDLLNDLKNPQAKAIIANLPYVSDGWDVPPETAYEPHRALFAGDEGMFLIKRLIAQIPGMLQPNGYLILEADPRQHAKIIAWAEKYQLAMQAKKDFALLFKMLPRPHFKTSSTFESLSSREKLAISCNKA